MNMTVGSKVKQTLAQLKGAQSTLMTYSAASRDGDARSAFDNAITVTGQVIADLEDRLRTIESQEPQYKGK
jgi:glycerol kinase